MTDPIKREPEQEDILATALILAQSYGDAHPGMAAEDWLAEARTLRSNVKAAGDVFYAETAEVVGGR